MFCKVFITATEAPYESILIKAPSALLFVIQLHEVISALRTRCLVRLWLGVAVFAEVYAFAITAPDLVSEFVELGFQNEGTLRITPTHFVFRYYTFCTKRCRCLAYCFAAKRREISCSTQRSFLLMSLSNLYSPSTFLKSIPVSEYCCTCRRHTK